MDGARERGEGGSERRRDGATQRGRGAREERVSKVDGEGGERQGRCPEEDAGQYTAHKTTHNVSLAIAPLVLQIQNCKRVYKLCIVKRRNVLFDRWMT